MQEILAWTVVSVKVVKTLRSEVWRWSIRRKMRSSLSLPSR